ncbi:HAMP domain-containing histidine kinase [Spirosoma aureum]|uniref:histidine kinase n=1 Tax=Spirosoma aureum TaxID=2692134 RepID=A0A6G9AGT6_9BACT|nr:HAMP domain-containing sensor histidine kinase [Spirosoma aureum]QIP11687.1 HAMP domain-containing histidine kinase [Spirosoma aureum]
MSTQRIRWIVALMAVGLLGLVGLQWYWISSALHLQKEQFDYKVTDALQEVVRTLERQEIWYLTKQRIQAREHQDRLMAIAKKEGKTPVKEVAVAKKTPALTQNKVASNPNRAVNPQPDPQRIPYGMAPAGAVVVQSDVLHPVAHPLSAEQMAVVEEFFRQQDELMAVGDWQTQLAQQQQFNQWVDQILVNELNQINGQVATARRQDSLARIKAVRNRLRQVAQQRKLQKAAQKDSAQTDLAVSRPASFTPHKAGEQSNMIKDVLKGLLLSDRPIEDRINRLALDTLLHQSLQERGISIPFAFGVRTKSQPAFLFTSLGMNPQQFREGGYKAALFPNNMLETGNYVYIYFPTQKEFILSQLWFTFSASAVLILVILACFYIAISTIVRQKKLADIKNDFINNMTHEFKTPISTISLAVEMAQEQVRHPQVTMGAGSDDSSVNERLSRYMGIIRDETRRLGSHVEKVLQMALLDRGEIKLKLSSVNVHDVIEKVLNNMSLQIEQREGELDLQFDADREVIEADEVHVTNILYNLLDNALKYSPESPHIALVTRSLPEGVSITVADHGLGMTKDQVSRIFEKFYRVPTGNRHDVKGFGLGLSYVKKMIDEHHGQIHVESELGKGSSFEVILPYKQEA